MSAASNVTRGFAGGGQSVHKGLTKSNRMESNLILLQYCTASAGLHSFTVKNAQFVLMALMSISDSSGPGFISLKIPSPNCKSSLCHTVPVFHLFNAALELRYYDSIFITRRAVTSVHTHKIKSVQEVRQQQS